MFTREINSNKRNVFPKDIQNCLRCPRLKAAATDSERAEDRLFAYLDYD